MKVIAIPKDVAVIAANTPGAAVTVDWITDDGNHNGSITVDVTDTETSLTFMRALEAGIANAVRGTFDIQNEALDLILIGGRSF